MDKEKLKELLENPELKDLVTDFNCFKDKSWNEFIERKKKQLEEPVYKTEDGYSVIEGYSVYHTILKDGYLSPLVKFAVNPKSDIKQFRLKANAENYLIENAEVLSLIDINDCYLKCAPLDSLLHKKLEDELKQKIRQKLGL